MSQCNGKDCGKEIAWLVLGDRTVPVDLVDGKMRQHVTLADGRKAVAIVLHHSTCPNANDFRKAKP